MANTIVLFAAAIAAVNILTFFIFSSSDLSLSASDFRPWALLTFQFAHFSSFHLIENLLGLVLTAALALELGVETRHFLSAYFLGAFAAIPLLLLFPSAHIAGNSTAIFGALAAALMHGRSILPPQLSYLLVVVFTFTVSAMGSAAALRSDIFHMAGFMAGAAISFTEIQANTRRKT